LSPSAVGMDLSNKNDKVKQVDATGQVDATSDNRDELNAGKDEVNIGKDDDEGNDSDSGSSNSSSNSSGSSLSLAAVSTDTSNKTPVAKIVHGDDGGDVSDFVDNGGYEGNDRDEGNEIDDDDKKGDGCNDVTEDADSPHSCWGCNKKIHSSLLCGDSILNLLSNNPSFIGVSLNNGRLFVLNALLCCWKPVKLKRVCCRKPNNLNPINMLC